MRIFALLSVIFPVLSLAQNATVQTCVVNQETSETPFCSLPKRYCGITGEEQLGKTEEAFKAYQDIFEEICKDYSAEEACPADPGRAPPCVIPDRQAFCNATDAPVVECAEDAECRVLPCYGTCATCQPPAVCAALVNQGRLAADGDTLCRGGSGSVAVSLAVAVAAAVALLL
eukprot:TRINITY_DN677_c0_g1_i2.p2 TRINITY_DN677_c0_g1~~TRINITY_DN677_c0_g1_i2.p2  ORF type:complete len:173 (-),score=22.84 TRINITY_DN677_c0_g1_i2:295-813(-)